MAQVDTARHKDFSEVLVAKSFETGNVLQRDFETPYADQEVNDRLSSHTRNSRAPEVLNACGRLSENAEYAIAFRMKQHRPLIVVLDNNDWLIHVGSAHMTFLKPNELRSATWSTTPVSRSRSAMARFAEHLVRPRCH